MRNTHKLFTIILFTITFVISSCKKEEEEIPGCTDPTMFNYNPDADNDNGTCIEFIAGCTDSSMFNYNPNANIDNDLCVEFLFGCTDSLASNFNLLANIDDGSCLPSFYVMALGVWNINPDCEDYTIPVVNTTISLNDQLPATIDVQEASGNLLFIEIGETQINGTIDNTGIITVPTQTILFEMADFGEIPLEVEGTGVIESLNSGTINLTYTFEIEIIPGLPIPGSLDCFIILSK
jgi:hypothetical protein